MAEFEVKPSKDGVFLVDDVVRAIDEYDKEHPQKNPFISDEEQKKIVLELESIRGPWSQVLIHPELFNALLFPDDLQYATQRKTIDKQVNELNERETIHHRFYKSKS